MTISKRTYAALTLPWRLLDGFVNLSIRPTPEGFSFVTGCKVFWYLVLYPLAWPAVVVLLLILAAAVPLAGLVQLLFTVTEFLSDRWALTMPECKRVTWKEDTPA